MAVLVAILLAAAVIQFTSVDPDPQVPTALVEESAVESKPTVSRSLRCPSAPAGARWRDLGPSRSVDDSRKSQ